MLRFNDGMNFNTDGPLRLTRRSDGWYVVGQGMLCPVDDPTEGRKMIADMTPDAAVENVVDAAWDDGCIVSG